MEEPGKLSLKRVELSLTKFNEVAIPHHLDLLRQHKTNIIKYGESGDTRRLRAEQTHARRVAGQLRALLAEMDALRAQVRQEDRARFDAMTQRTRDLTLRAIVDYLGVIERSCRGLVGAGREGARRESSPVTIRRMEAEAAEAEAGSARSTESVGVVAHAPAQLQLHHDEQEAALREREAVLRGWGELQAEVRALHDAWRHVHEAARLQREQVQAADGAVETAALEVTAARRHLSVAQRMSVGLASVGCAALGAAVGGPVGLLAGAKAGAAAALLGAAVGLFA
ncbi:syntaxin-17 [Papilio machaon]|uniref:syntaxin-17 n=1 Tax=Papilio machaon TaxID=76193 RepID=UPI001E663F47|nr:syntaxin-17 [Papilio machaon]